jgi:hypothetical protein
MTQAATESTPDVAKTSAHPAAPLRSDREHQRATNRQPRKISHHAISDLGSERVDCPRATLAELILK